MAKITFDSSWIALIAELPERLQGDFYKAVVLYQLTRFKPTFENPLLAMTFQVILRDLDRSELRRKCGKMGAEARWENGNTDTPNGKTMANHKLPNSQPLDSHSQEIPSDSFPHTPILLLPEEEKKNKTSSLKRKSEWVALNPPTLEEVKAYCTEKSYNIDAEHFLAHQEQVEWKTKNGQKIVSWKAALTTWSKYSRPQQQQSTCPSPRRITTSLQALKDMM